MVQEITDKNRIKLNSFSQQKDKILLIDFSNLFYFSKPAHLNDSLLEGHYSIVEQFIINLNSYVRMFQPTSIILTDDNFPKWRKNIYPLYKENRKKNSLEYTDIDKAYYNNKQKIRKSLKDVLPIYYFRVEELEADDICYLVCNKIRTTEIILMSGDEDLMQIAQKYPHVKVYSPNRKKIIEIPELDIVRYKILVGCSSDNIKGFPGIGKQKGKIILKDKKTFNYWYNNLSEEQLELYKNLKDIISLEKIPQQYKDKFEKEFYSYKFKKYDENKFKKFIDEYNFSRIHIRYITENFENLKQL